MWLQKQFRVGNCRFIGTNDRPRAKAGRERHTPCKTNGSAVQAPFNHLSFNAKTSLCFIVFHQYPLTRKGVQGTHG